MVVLIRCFSVLAYVFAGLNSLRGASRVSFDVCCVLSVGCCLLLVVCY